MFSIQQTHVPALDCGFIYSIGVNTWSVIFWICKPLGYEADQSGRGTERATEMPKEKGDQQGVGAGRRSSQQRRHPYEEKGLRELRLRSQWKILQYVAVMQQKQQYMLNSMYLLNCVLNDSCFKKGWDKIFCWRSNLSEKQKNCS